RRAGLLEDGPDQGRHPRLGALGYPGEQVAVVVRPAALPPAPGSTPTIAFTSSAWSSLVTRATPDRPRAARPRRNARHPAPSPELVTAAPRISPHPPPSRPV